MQFRVLALFLVACTAMISAAPHQEHEQCVPDDGFCTRDSQCCVTFAGACPIIPGDGFGWCVPKHTQSPVYEVGTVI
ncbi:hypothetical protein C8R47DRAFT_1324952 [Mycena vitilis]|nr:hypothetical protein C8R47DRAFT_1324952 [Mycena vitilis]